jgi:CDGSH-type Zn-finger protein
MAEPTIAQKSPFAVEVKEGERYFWCSCGNSEAQPFCDVAHVGTDFRPVRYKAEKAEKKYFCGCKQTSTPPFCDGTHNNL